nr:MAG TPA: hypothetical protein [Caudoviricetes sp.]DAE86415.1 MAG TPA: hypothetical protein [Caudoviricetes sp.]
MSMYLEPFEMEEYGAIIPFDETHVKFASTMIDAYIGTNNGKSKFTSNTTTEVIKPTRKGLLILKNDPVIDIVSIQGVTTRDVHEDGVEIEPYLYDFDGSKYVYLSNNSANMTYSKIFLRNARYYKVTYKYGFDEIPEEVKTACAMLAMNISQVSTFTALDSMTTLDARFSLADPNLFTNEIKSLLSRYRF